MRALAAMLREWIDVGFLKVLSRHASSNIAVIMLFAMTGEIVKRMVPVGDLRTKLLDIEEFVLVTLVLWLACVLITLVLWRTCAFVYELWPHRDHHKR